MVLLKIGESALILYKGVCMKKTKLFLSLVAAAVLIVSALAVNVAAVGSGPATGSYVITNTSNNLELAVSSGNPILDTAGGYKWKLTEMPEGRPYYYSIITSDGTAALTLDAASGGCYLSKPNISDPDQRWMVSRVSGGYQIQAYDTVSEVGQRATDDNFLCAASRSMSVPGAVKADKLANGNPQWVWTITVSRATPTPIPQSKAPAPACQPPNGTTLRDGDTIQLSVPYNIPGAYVVYTMTDPSRYNNVTWYQTTTPITVPSAGTLELWAKTVGARGYADSDIMYFTFPIQRYQATPTPPPYRPTPTPTRPLQNLTQVILKVTMNQLRYTVNGVPMMFDVAPYLDTKANRSMIPMRFIAEAFGARVEWDDATQTQTISLNGRTFKLTANVPLPDGMGTPVLVKDRFFVPLRYVSQELGASVDWDNATSTNTIIYYK